MNVCLGEIIGKQERIKEGKGICKHLNSFANQGQKQR